MNYDIYGFWRSPDQYEVAGDTGDTSDDDEDG